MKKLLLCLPLLFPITVMAASGYDETGIFTNKELYDVCTKLILPITQNYKVLELKQSPEGAFQVGANYVTCSYGAVTTESTPVTVTAVLNLSTNQIDDVVLR